MRVLKSDFKLSEEVKYRLSKELVDYLDRPVVRVSNTWELAENIIEIMEEIMKNQYEKDLEELRRMR